MEEPQIRKPIYEFDDLDSLDIELSKIEEEQLNELLELQKSINNNTPNFFQELLNAVEKGAINYVNSFIDTSEVFDEMKNPSSVKRAEESDIKLKNSGNISFRTLGEATQSPYSSASIVDKSILSDKGRRAFSTYEKQYEQRVKTVIEHKGSNKLNDRNSNISLAGLDSFRFGPKVSCYTPEEYKQMWQTEVSNNGGQPTIGLTAWIRDKNYEKLAERYMKDCGFTSKTQFENWCKQAKLTPHETPDGIFLVPTDVHEKEVHAGYQSEVHGYIEGKISLEEANKIERDQKVTLVLQECGVRGLRALNGAKMAAIKTLLQNVIKILIAESIKEFKIESEQSLYERLKSIAVKCYQRFKEELSDIWNQIKQGAMYSAGMEILTALNDLLFKTAKNIFRIIRSMVGSIISALKIIFGKEHSLEERMFEAAKIVAAGLVAALGFSLDEIIEDFIITSIPFLAPAAHFIADVLAGLFANILSAIVLAGFDSYKQYLQIKDEKTKALILTSSLIATNGARVNISALKAGESALSAQEFFDYCLKHITDSRQRIMESNKGLEQKTSDIRISTTTIKETGNHVDVNISRLLSDDE